jgi:hypothetical protein
VSLDTLADYADTFIDLFRFGVPQLDAWKPTAIPAPESPRAPWHPRPARTLPPRPSEWAILRALLTPAEADLHEAIDWPEALDAIREAWGRSDPDCLEGRRLALESLTNAPPEDWDAEVADALWRTLGVAETAYAEAEAAHWRTVREIQTAPDADPAWRTYDEAVVAYPARCAEHREAVKARARELTGFATEEEATADYLAACARRGVDAIPGYMARGGRLGEGALSSPGAGSGWGMVRVPGVATERGGEVGGDWGSDLTTASEEERRRVRSTKRSTAQKRATNGQSRRPSITCGLCHATRRDTQGVETWAPDDEHTSSTDRQADADGHPPHAPQGRPTA